MSTISRLWAASGPLFDVIPQGQSFAAVIGTNETIEFQPDSGVSVPGFILPNPTGYTLAFYVAYSESDGPIITIPNSSITTAASGATISVPITQSQTENLEPHDYYFELRRLDSPDVLSRGTFTLYGSPLFNPPPTPPQGVVIQVGNGGSGNAGLTTSVGILCQASVGGTFQSAILSGATFASGTLTITGGGGGGAVSSVFGRTGVVVAQSGDYTAAQVGADAAGAAAAVSASLSAYVAKSGGTMSGALSVGGSDTLLINPDGSVSFGGSGFTVDESGNTTANKLTVSNILLDGTNGTFTGAISWSGGTLAAGGEVICSGIDTPYIFSSGTAVAEPATTTLLVPWNLGTPSAVVLTNATGTASSLVAGGNLAVSSIAVSGQTTVTSASRAQTLTFVAGANITLTTDNSAKSVTIAASASSGMTNPMTTLGDTIYENATPAPARLAGNTTTAKQYLSQTGTGSASAAPAWATIAAADLSDGNSGTGAIAHVSSPTFVTPVMGAATGTSVSVSGNVTGASFVGSIAAGSLSGTTLPSAIVGSSLTSVGTLASPVMTTPTLGVAAATTVNKVTITAPATAATLTLAQGSTLVTAGAFSITLTSTAGTTVTLPTTGTLATLAGTETWTNKTLTGPTMTAPLLGTPASGTLTSCSGYLAASLSGSTLASGVTVSSLTSFGTSPVIVTPKFEDSTDATKAITFTLSGIATSTTRNVTWPDASGTVTLLGNTTTGTGSTIALATSPTFVTPLLGTPTSGVLTNCTGTAAGLTAGTASAVAASGITGTTLASNVVISSLTQVATLQSPTMVSPVLGSASGTSLNLSSSLTAAGFVQGQSVNIVNGTTTGVLSASGGNITLSSATAFLVSGNVSASGTITGSTFNGAATGLTGTATSLTSGITNALASATTTVNVSSATAPTSGQILTATSGTAATWQNPPTGTSGTSLFNHFADVSTSSTNGTFDSLYSDTIPAGQLTANGDKIVAQYGGTIVQSATATRDFKLAFGGTTIFDSGALTANLASAAWSIAVLIIRVDASNVRCKIVGVFDGTTTTTVCNYTAVTGLTLANTQALALTCAAAGTGAAASDVTAKLSNVSYVGA